MSSRNAYLTALKISKLLLNAVGYAYVQMVAEAMQNEPSPVTISVVIHSHAVLLQKALQSIPNPNSECMIRSMAVKLGQFLSHRVRIFFMRYSDFKFPGTWSSWSYYAMLSGELVLLSKV